MIKFLECSIRDLSPEIISNTRLIVEFKNTTKCKPFDAITSQPLKGPNLSLLSTVTFPTQFRCGELWENFASDRTYKCILPDGTTQTQNSTVKADAQLSSDGKPIGIQIPYYPQTELEARLRFVGGYFETAPEGIGL